MEVTKKRKQIVHTQNQTHNEIESKIDISKKDTIVQDYPINVRDSNSKKIKKQQNKVEEVVHEIKIDQAGADKVQESQEAPALTKKELKKLKRQLRRQREAEEALQKISEPDVDNDQKYTSKQPGDQQPTQKQPENEKPSTKITNVKTNGIAQLKSEKISKKTDIKDQVEPKIIKKPKITIICEEDELAEEEKLREQQAQAKKQVGKMPISNIEAEEEDDSDLEELKRVKRQMRGNSDDSDSEENFKDLDVEDEEESEAQKTKKSKKQNEQKKNTKAISKKTKDESVQNKSYGKSQIKKLTDKIQLKHLAICIPDSIISIPQSSELRSYFISELARTAAIFSVDEIIILKDNSYIAKSQNFQQGPYIARNLQYLETPQYLRKLLFPIHPDLKNAGLMNPIECHHHLKSDQPCDYREGVVLNRPVKEGDGSWVEIGLKKQAKIPYKLAYNTRVTLKIDDPTNESEEHKFFTAEVVTQKEPKEKLGLFWGYQVRLAENLTQVFKGENDIQYDIKLLINEGDHPQLTEESVLEAAPDFHDKSGYNNLESIVDSDEYSRLTGKDALQKFNANFTIQKGCYGVKQLRLEEEMTLALSTLRKQFC